MIFDSRLRHPRLHLTINQDAVPGVIDAEVLSNAFYAADRFRARIAYSPSSPGIASEWIKSDELSCAIKVTMDGDQVNLIEGRVDSINIDPLGGVVRIEGRDYSADLIEARTQETFSNRTASEIAELLAARHGLSSEVKRTTTPVGRYWQLEHDRLTLNAFVHATTEWDLLTTLAQYEGLEVWVEGRVLHFGSTPPADPILAITPASCVDLQLERSLTLAQDIEVIVKSWHSRNGRAFVQTVRRQRAGGESTIAAKRYVYIVPNLTPEDALRLAQRRLAEITRHERLICVEMPGELTASPRRQLQLVGTGTDFDRTYWIDEVERRLSFTHGFTQRIRARNSPAESQAVAPADKVIGVWTDS